MGKHLILMSYRTYILPTIIIVNFVSTIAVTAQLDNYYSTINGQSGNVLKSALNSIIDNHTSLSYTPGVWNAHKDLYEDPNNSNNIILFYSQASVSKETQAGSGGTGSTAFNREHLWPRSYGVGDTGSDNTDLHNLVPTYAGVNSSRSNKYFDYSDPEAAGYSSPAYYLAPQCTSTNETFEPGDGQKGKAARAIFYMSTRYNYLELINTPPSAAPVTNGNQMAQLNTLLKWNRDFLPTNNERLVNQKIYTYYQGNRNPYTDYPEFADAVWVEGPSWGKWRLDNFSLSELLDSSVSGDNADPDQDGIKNLLERAMYTDPREKNTTDALTAQLVNGILKISFTRAIDSSNLNASIKLERSLDLNNWTTVDLSEATVNTISPEREKVTLFLDSANSGTSDIITEETFVNSTSQLSLINVEGEDNWSLNEYPNTSSAWINTYTNYAWIDGYGGTGSEQDWLIFPSIDLSSHSNEQLIFNYASQYPDTATTGAGLEIFYTNEYTLDPTTTTWSAFSSTNDLLNLNKSTTNSPTSLNSLNIDLSTISGDSVVIGIKYTSTDEVEQARLWFIQNPQLTGDLTTTVTLGSGEGQTAPAQYYRMIAINAAGESLDGSSGGETDVSSGPEIDYETVTSGGGIDYETATIFSENFNNTDLFTTSSNLFSDGFADYFGLTGDDNGIEAYYGDGLIPSNLMEFTGATGSYMIAEDLDGEGAELPITVTWPDINIMGQSGLVVSVDIGASTNSIDSNDDLLIEYQIDDTGYITLLDFGFLPDEGNSFNNVFELSGSLGVITLSEALQSFTVPIPENGSSLDLRLTVSLNAGNESFAIDNLDVSAASSP